MKTYGTLHDFGRAKAALALLGNGAGLPTPGTLAALPEGRMTVQQRAAGGPEPIRDQRRVASNGILMVAGQKVAIGRPFKHTTPHRAGLQTTLAIELPRGETRVFRRTTDDAGVASKDSGHGPLTPQFPRPDVAHQRADRRRTPTVGSQRHRDPAPAPEHARHPCTRPPGDLDVAIGGGGRDADLAAAVKICRTAMTESGNFIDADWRLLDARIAWNRPAPCEGGH